MADSEEISGYRLQLEHVEAALALEPGNGELSKLKDDLMEIIGLCEDLTESTKTTGAAVVVESLTNNKTTNANRWKVGDRCLAPQGNGQKCPAIIDGFAQGSASVTFVGRGTKAVVEMGDLEIPKEENKSFIWEKLKNPHGRKSEWQMERERRKMRALKKEGRKKELEELKEEEKRNWLSFNAKASNRSMKGFKRPTASGSAPDGPARGIVSQTSISSRRDIGAFKSTQRGNMDSLF